MSERENNTKLIDPDFLAEGFHRIDPKYVSAKPPKIKWGIVYQNMSMREKVRYLEKFAASMNHAAFLVQQERDHFGSLAEDKERQIESLNRSLEQNNAMIQSEITKMNEERQQYNAAYAKIKARVRELEKDGNND